MALWRLRELSGVQVCCQCFMFLLPVIHRTEAIAITTEGVTAGNHANTASRQSSGVDDDMVKGMAAGFGFFFGLIILVCLVWCLCCSNVCTNKDSVPEKRLKSKVGPSPPSSANVRTRPNASGVSSP